MTRHRINPVDAIWLHTDRVQNLMVIECVMFLEGPVDRAAVEQLLRDRLVDVYPVFSRRPAAGRRRWSKPHWEDVPGFDPADHVRDVQLPWPGDSTTLQTHIGGSLATPLPRDRPLWDVHLVTGLDEGSAIYVRLHHALADGMALTEVLLSLTDASPGGAVTRSAATTSGQAGVDVDRHDTKHQGAPTVDPGASMAPWPSRLVATSRTVAQAAGVLTKLLVTRNPPSSLVGAAGAHKAATWSDPIDLPLVKDIARASGSTVNDVLVSALSGALGHYQRERGARAVDLPTMIPVNLRPPGVPLPRELGNCFAIVLLLLPSGLSGAAERLAETKHRMDTIKRSPEPVITFALIGGIGRLGRRLSRALITFFAGKVSGVTTNVPGPREPRYLAGVRITGLLGWVPGSANQTLGTCIFTYDGTVRIGLKTDATVIDDPACILRAFHREIDTLADELVTSLVAPAASH